MDEDTKFGVALSVGGVTLLVILLGVVAFGMWGCPQYKVYEQRLHGEAELAQAQYTRQIAIAEANARLESAKLDAQSEIERAHGVAQANQIIGNSLEGHESYLRYLWIMGLRSTAREVIYVPTEANLPILEAQRLQEK